MFAACHTFDDLSPLEVQKSVASVLSIINPSHFKNIFLGREVYPDLDLVPIFQVLPSVDVYSFDY